jgi:hypothetical protein
MKEIKLTIDGKEVQLTEEHLKRLGIESEKKRKNPFERVTKSEMYCYIDSFNEVQCVSDDMDQCDDMSFECSNYFNDEDFAQQVALHQLLYRKLLKFAYDNGFEDTTEWDEINTHWSIEYDAHCNAFTPDWHKIYKMRDVYFSSPEGASRAIEEVVKPFMEEHPEFVW